MTLPRLRGSLIRIYRWHMKETCSWDKEAAYRRTLQDVLRGFRSLQEAEENAMGLKDQDLCGYTLAGFPIYAKTILDALRIARQYSDLAPNIPERR